jgi:hypothetical protein
MVVMVVRDYDDIFSEIVNKYKFIDSFECYESDISIQSIVCFKTKNGDTLMFSRNIDDPIEGFVNEIRISLNKRSGDGSL